MALPSARAIFCESCLTLTLCLPSAIAGPFCSVPPIGMMIVVLPPATASRSSVHVRSSRNTDAGSSARLADASPRIAGRTSMAKPVANNRRTRSIFSIIRDLAHRVMSCRNRARSSLRWVMRLPCRWTRKCRRGTSPQSLHPQPRCCAPHPPRCGSSHRRPAVSEH